MWFYILLAFLFGGLLGGVIVNVIYEKDGYVVPLEIDGEEYYYDKSEGFYTDQEIYENVTVVISTNSKNKKIQDVSWFRQDNTKQLSEDEWIERLLSSDMLKAMIDEAKSKQNKK